MQSGRDVFREEADRLHDRLARDRSADVGLEEEPGETQLVSQRRQTFRHSVRRTVSEARPEQLVVVGAGDATGEFSPLRSTARALRC